MKICIVTMFHNMNCGSYWQAYALGKYLENQGHTVCYLNRKKFGKSGFTIRKHTINTAKAFLKHGISGVKKYRYRTKAFQSAADQFSVIPDRKKYFRDMDCFVIGSDTLWDFNVRFFEKHYKIFSGQRFAPTPVVAYAVSAGNTSLETYPGKWKLARDIDRMSGLSVRDSNTGNSIKSLTNKQVSLVCDPTMLLTREDYRRFLRPSGTKPYIYLYLFRDLTQEQWDELYSFCKKKDLLIMGYSGNRRERTYDIEIFNTPIEFLNAIAGASYVITDTFHGTVFSINFEKNFIAVDRGKKKVNDLCRRLGLEDRLIEAGSPLVPALETNVDYQKNRDVVLEYRRDSRKYLDNAVCRER